MKQHKLLVAEKPTNENNCTGCFFENYGGCPNNQTDEKHISCIDGAYPIIFVLDDVWS